METPRELIGRENAKTDRAYRKGIHEGQGTSDLKLARTRRDARLGEIRAEETKVLAEKAGDTELALRNAEALQRVRNPVVKEAMTEDIEKYATDAIAPTAGFEKAKHWRDVARGKKIPVALIYEKYRLNGRPHPPSSTTPS